MPEEHQIKTAQKPYEKLTAQKEIEICNTINTAIAEGKIVMMDYARIAGAFPNYGSICCIFHDNWNDADKVPCTRLKGQTIQIYAPEPEVAYSPAKGCYSTCEPKIP